MYKIYVSEKKGKVWGLFFRYQTETEKNVRGFGKNYFKEVYPKTSYILGSRKTSGRAWNEKGHYLYENKWRHIGFRFRGFGLYKSFEFLIANETKKPSYL